MLKKNKIIISAIIILLPMLFGAIMWNELPDTMTTHFGADGVADGFSGKGLAVFGMPAMLLVLHFVCLIFTALDKKGRDQSEKALGLIFWIVPMISLVANGIMYRAAFGAKINPALLLCVLFGAMFIFMGNYLPKIKQNRTLGIKVTWALRNEENWSMTHRFGGKVWVICGFAMLLCAFLPTKALIIALIAITAVAVIAPTVYSYLIYRRHKEQGVEYGIESAGKAEKIAVRISAVLIPIILVGAAVLMFTGDIEVDCGGSSLEIEATYYDDIELAYGDIDTVAYRDDLDVGTRTFGFGSARLLMGIFENEEFGSYTLYSYTGADEFVVVTSGEKTLVIGMRDAAETKAIYDAISEKIGEK